MRNCVHITRTSTNQQDMDNCTKNMANYIMSRYKFYCVMGSHHTFYFVMGSF